MPPEESVEALPSADNGNVPAEAPSPEPKPETPAEPVEPAKPAEKPSEPELYELPDGRKVDAVTLTKEWKENFLPDYTRKSQELAQKNKAPEAPLQDNKTANPLDPNWVPQSYAELVTLAQQKAIDAIEAKERERVEREQALENAVSEQLTEVKKADPTINENALFLHATKYGFRDLRVAHQNMKDMNELAKKVQNTTVQNIAKRNDPVSASPGATGARPDPNQFSNAIEYLRSLK